MRLTESELSGLISGADPLDDELPPAPGSVRHQSILSIATREPIEAPAARNPRWRVTVLAASSIAALALVAAGVVVEQLPGEQSAAAAVRSALDHQQGVDSFAFSGTIETAMGYRISLSGRAHGEDRQVDLTGAHAGSTSVRQMSMTMVGDRVYTTADGRATVRPRQPTEQVFGPGLAAVSKAIVDGLADADVTRAGSEVIAGASAARYEVALSERSRATFSTAPIGLPTDMERLVLWIAHDQLRQIQMTTSGGDEIRYTFSDIGAAISITAPPGDFTADPVPIGFLYESPEGGSR